MATELLRTLSVVSRPCSVAGLANADVGVEATCAGRAQTVLKKFEVSRTRRNGPVTCQDWGLSSAPPVLGEFGEFGDEPIRSATAKSRKNYAEPSPSPERQTPRRSCWPATSATNASPMHLLEGARVPDRLYRRPLLLQPAPDR